MNEWQQDAFEQNVYLNYPPCFLWERYLHWYIFALSLISFCPLNFDPHPVLIFGPEIELSFFSARVQGKDEKRRWKDQIIWRSSAHQLTILAPYPDVEPLIRSEGKAMTPTKSKISTLGAFSG